MAGDNIADVKKQYLMSLREGYKYSISKFDEQTLLLNSGALGLTLTFIKDIVPLKDSQCILLFYLAISIFAIAIGVGFFAHWYSSEAINKTIKEVESNNENIQIDKYIPKINLGLLTLTVVGILLLVIYCIINIHSYRSISTEASSKSTLKIEKTISNDGKLIIEGEITKVKMDDSTNSSTKINIK